MKEGKLVVQTSFVQLRLYKYLRKEGKWKAKENGKIHPTENRVPEIRREKKTFLKEQCKEREENHRIGKTEISSRKLEIPREYFMQGWA